MSTEWEKRITFNPQQCGGQPCIRGMRIRRVFEMIWPVDIK